VGAQMAGNWEAELKRGKKVTEKEERDARCRPKRDRTQYLNDEKEPEFKRERAAGRKGEKKEPCQKANKPGVQNRRVLRERTGKSQYADQ